LRRGEIELEIGEEGGVIFGVFEDEAFVDATVVDVVVATWLVFFEGVFAGHWFNYIIVFLRDLRGDSLKVG